MTSNTIFLFEHNGFKIYKLQVFGNTFFIAERQEGETVKRVVRRSMRLMEEAVKDK